MSKGTDTHRERVQTRLDPRHEELLLSQREELYREIFEDSPVAVRVEDWSRTKLMIDGLARRGVKDWRRYFERRPDQLIKANDLCDVIDVNAATLSVYGAMSKEDVVPSSSGAALTAGGLKLFCDQIVAVAGGAAHFVTEAAETAMDGSEIFTCVRGMIPREHRDNWSRVIFTMEDITERKRTEEALRESEVRYRTLATVAPVGIFHTDAQGLVTYVNEKWCEIGGMTAEQAMGTGWLAGLHPEDLAPIAAKWNAFVKNQTTFNTEYRYQRSDGVTAYCYVQALPETDADGKLVGYVGYLTDITERKRTEETLKESERTLAAAQRIAGLGHWLWDEVDNRIITVSEQLARIFGVEPEEFPRTSEGWYAFIHPDDRERAVTEIERCIANQSGFDLEYRIVRGDGQIRFVRDLSEPLFDDGGRFVRTLGTLLDITDLKLVEQALRESEERLRASLREKEVLLEEVHHRVKNNFQFIALLLSPPTSVPRHERQLGDLEEIKRRILVMAGLYEYLLASDDLDHVNTKDILTEIINHLATSLVSEDRQPRFRVDIEDVALTINQALVCGQIICELVSNSLKHAFTGNSSGTVDICLRKASNSEFLLTVKDDGVGLSKNFDVEACEGFGFRIVTALVNQLGGAIEAKNSQGASFQIKFGEKR